VYKKSRKLGKGNQMTENKNEGKMPIDEIMEKYMIKQQILSHKEVSVLIGRIGLLNEINRRLANKNAKLQSLEAKLAEAIEALEFYAAEGGNRFLTEWDNRHVCDSYSGALATFDWSGDLQDEPWEIARTTLAKLRGAKP
jgi:hypothetical protein